MATTSLFVTGHGQTNSTMKSTLSSEEGFDEIIGDDAVWNYINSTMIEDNGKSWNIDHTYILEATSFTPSPMLFQGDASYVEWDISQVPIPGAVWLFASCLIGLVGIKRRLNKEPNNNTAITERQDQIWSPAFSFL